MIPLSFRMSKGNKRVVYTVLEYSPLLDSSNMTTDDWGRIGKDIEVCTLYIHTHTHTRHKHQGSPTPGLWTGTSP